MILDTRVSHPHAQTYLVKLHVDSDPQNGRLAGRLEHLATGRRFSFASAQELIDCLARAAALGRSAPA